MNEWQEMSIDLAKPSAEQFNSPPCRSSFGAHAIECTEHVRNRIFNLGYYTWVEQQGTPIELFDARRSQRQLNGTAGSAR